MQHERIPQRLSEEMADILGLTHAFKHAGEGHRMLVARSQSLAKYAKYHGSMWRVVRADNGFMLEVVDIPLMSGDGLAEALEQIQAPEVDLNTRIHDHVDKGNQLQREVEDLQSTLDEMAEDLAEDPPPVERVNPMVTDQVNYVNGPDISHMASKTAANRVWDWKTVKPELIDGLQYGDKPVVDRLTSIGEGDLGDEISEKLYQGMSDEEVVDSLSPSVEATQAIADVLGMNEDYYWNEFTAPTPDAEDFFKGLTSKIAGQSPPEDNGSGKAKVVDKGRARHLELIDGDYAGHMADSLDSLEDYEPGTVVNVDWTLWGEGEPLEARVTGLAEPEEDPTDFFKDLTSSIKTAAMMVIETSREYPGSVCDVCLPKEGMKVDEFTELPPYHAECKCRVVDASAFGGYQPYEEPSTETSMQEFDEQVEDFMEDPFTAKVAVTLIDSDLQESIDFFLNDEHFPRRFFYLDRNDDPGVADLDEDPEDWDHTLGYHFDNKSNAFRNKKEFEEFMKQDHYWSDNPEFIAEIRAAGDKFYGENPGGSAPTENPEDFFKGLTSTYMKPPSDPLKGLPPSASFREAIGDYLDAGWPRKFFAVSPGGGDTVGVDLDQDPLSWVDVLDRHHSDKRYHAFRTKDEFDAFMQQPHWWDGDRREDEIIEESGEFYGETAPDFFKGLVSVTPPGKEDVVRSLKNEEDVDNPYAIAWGQYNKEHGKKASTSVDEETKSKIWDLMVDELDTIEGELFPEYDTQLLDAAQHLIPLDPSGDYPKWAYDMAAELLGAEPDELPEETEDPEEFFKGLTSILKTAEKARYTGTSEVEVVGGEHDGMKVNITNDYDLQHAKEYTHGNPGALGRDLVDGDLIDIDIYSDIDGEFDHDFIEGSFNGMWVGEDDPEDDPSDFFKGLT